MFYICSMTAAVAIRADRELQMLEGMVDCAHRLALAFGEAAEAERDVAAQLRLFDAFQRGFLAVRMGIRLSLTLRAPLKAATTRTGDAERIERLERETLETERLEIERPEGLEVERE